MTQEELTGANFDGQLTVGDVFKFGILERALITVVTTEYDKRCKVTRNNIMDIQGSTVDVDIIRGRSVLLQDVIGKSKPEDEITLKHPLRVTLGAGLSLHSRWLRKEKEKVAGRVVSVNDIEKAIELTTHIANTIGEQLQLYVPTDDDETTGVK